MKIIEVLIERKAEALNRTFTYLYNGDKNLDKGFRVLVDFNKKKLLAYVLSTKLTSKSKEELEKEMGYRLSFIIDIIDEKPLLNDELMLLSDKLSDYYLSPKIAFLQTMLPKSLKPMMSALKGPKIAYDKYLYVVNGEEDGLTPKQIEVLRLIKNNDNVLKKEVKSVSVVKKLLDLELIAERLVEKRRLKLGKQVTIPPKVLTSEQKNAVESILKSDKPVTLLQGVTGSGKTEIYLSLAEKILKEGKGVLILVPEISLTSMMVSYFLSRFADVAILHSELTLAEKYDEYRRIVDNKCHIVVGARSAIFAPLSNIGLIVLDEEHVETYKQDTLPFYHAREVALMRAKYFNAKVVLGSATPSLETKARAMKGVYHYVELSKRINDVSLPETTIIDMSKSANLSNESSMFSLTLKKAIEETLKKNEQVILLINKRGFASAISCRKCGHIFKCPNCKLALTYHQEDNMLKCHHCGHVELMRDTCPVCGSSYLSRIGFGTERIVKEVKKIFNNARVLRLDSDVGEIKHFVALTLKKFANHEADILVGTEMIAKGHDFKNVTLVGVVSADIGLSLPSFRSTERVFQLITQAVGRSGRSELKGRAIIQTYNPRHYAIILAARQDYESFFKTEMKVRKASQYPPYTYLISLSFKAKNEESLIKFVSDLAGKLIDQNFDNVTVLGPIKPYFVEPDNFTRILLLKYKDSVKIYSWLRKLLTLMRGKSQISLSVDVDPYSF